MNNKNGEVMNRMKNICQIGKLIRKKRKSMKLTQKDLADLCNLGTRFISDLENGKKTLEIEKVLKVIRNVGLYIDVCERKIT